MEYTPDLEHCHTGIVAYTQELDDPFMLWLQGEHSPEAFT